MKDPFILEFWDGSIMRTYLHFPDLAWSQRFLFAVIQKAKYKFMTPKRIRVASLEWPSEEPIDIFSDDLERIIEYEPTPKEKTTILAAPYDGFAARLRGGVRVATPPLSDDYPVRVPTASSRKLNDVAAPIKQRDGAVTLSDICADHKIDPRKARAVLRRKKITKPYTFDDESEILALLKKEIK